VPDKTWTESKATVDDFADSIIRDALNHQQSASSEKSPKSEDTNSKERYIFLQELLKQTQDPQTLRCELLNILLAGRDSTASLLTNTWFTLARRPDIWTKLRAEVATLNNQPPTYTQLKELKYLRHLLNESLRLMPIVPVNGRRAIHDTTLPTGGGPAGKSPVFVPRGTIVLFHMWSMHRRADLFGPDAEQFRPERWETLRPTWEYLPFSGGPRVCVGQQFALTEAGYTTVRLVQAFARLESRDERDWCEAPGLTLTSGVGCRVALFES
jgi:cytochrome P450